MTLTPVTARVLAVARKSAPELAGTTTKTRRQLDGANEHQPGQFARLCLKVWTLDTCKDSVIVGLALILENKWKVKDVEKIDKFISKLSGGVA